MKIYKMEFFFQKIIVYVYQFEVGSLGTNTRWIRILSDTVKIFQVSYVKQNIPA